MINQAVVLIINKTKSQRILDNYYESTVDCTIITYNNILLY